MGKFFLLLDGRAKTGDKGRDRAAILDTADTEEECRADGQEFWSEYDAIWFEYDQEGQTLTNPRPRWDLPPASK